MNPSLLALFVLRVVGPAILLLNACSLLFIHAPIQQSHSSEITPVVVRVVVPRRLLIVTLLYVAAATYFFDGLLVVILAVLNGTWQGSQDEWRGVDGGAFLGLIAFATVAILGTVKESQGKEVWLSQRIRAFAIFACTFDIAIVVLMALNIDFRNEGICLEVSVKRTELILCAHSDPKIPENPYGVSIPKFSHLALASLRLLASLPLL